MLKLVNFPRRI